MAGGDITLPANVLGMPIEFDVATTNDVNECLVVFHSNGDIHVYEDPNDVKKAGGSVQHFGRRCVLPDGKLWESIPGIPYVKEWLSPAGAT